MTSPLHSAASHHLPPFITAPGETDILFVITNFVVILMILIVGTLLLQLHTLPERMAHKSKKLQFDVVAVLGLLSLFTHEHLYWVAGLLLALIDFPDFTSPFNRIAGSLEKLADIKPDDTKPDIQPKASQPQSEEGARHA